MQVDLYSKDGEVTGKIELNDSVFSIEPNEHAMHTVVVAHLAHRRQGTAKTKVRSEVRGGGKKPWKQKGRGTARAGSTRSPIWVGGGTIHGPKPRVYNVKVPKKLNRLSRISAYSLRNQESNLKVVKDFELPEVKTKEVAKILNNLELNNGSTLIITGSISKTLWLSSRNIPKTNVKSFDSVSTYDLLSHKKIMLLESAVKSIEGILS
ncbi:50S ribosomal protein L4 [Candidatus Kapabacteria bacterium]|nr:50S ribosomal protein L4 [Candidatus Kapabacteria bacterium]